MRDGYYRPLPPTVFVQEDGTEELRRQLEFFKVAYQCSACENHYVWQSVEEFISIGFWPTTVQRVNTIIDERVLEACRKLQHAAPKVSRGAFLSVVSSGDQPYGGKGMPIDQNSFSYAYDEYRLANMAKEIECKYINSLECLACGEAPHAVHVDGNHKLFVWDRQQGHTRRATTADILYSRDAAVMQHLEYLDLALGPNQQVDARCSGLWRAADINKTPSGSKFCNGRIYAVCRHSIPLAAVNMIKTGENYGYASFLCSKKLYPAGVKFVYQDIACKYAKWLTNVSRAAREQAPLTEEQRLERDLLLSPHDAQHILAEAHGRLHSVWCWGVAMERLNGQLQVALAKLAEEQQSKQRLQDQVTKLKEQLGTGGPGDQGPRPLGGDAAGGHAEGPHSLIACATTSRGSSAAAGG